jgi:Coenzyme PQQ synthesis protein D (PqqD)
MELTHLPALMRLFHALRCFSENFELLLVFHRPAMSKCAAEQDKVNNSVVQSMYRVPDTLRRIHGRDGGTILDLRNGSILRLNFTASLIFERLSNGKTRSEIVNELSGQCGVPQDRVEKDVAEFISAVEERELLICNRSEDRDHAN